MYPLTTNSNSLAKKSKWEEPHLSSSSCPPSAIQNLYHLITHLFLPHTQQQLQPTTTASENLPPQNLIASKFYPKSGDQSADRWICGSIDQSFRYCFFFFWFCFCAPGRRVRKSCFFARIARSPSSANPSPDCGAFQSWLPNLSTTHYGKWCVSVKEQQIQCRHSQIWSSKIVVVAGVLLLFSSHHDNNIPIRSTISAVNNPFFFLLLFFFQGCLFTQRIIILV